MKCPWCGSTDVTCDTVDVGVGEMQSGPYGCENCHAVQLDMWPGSGVSALEATVDELRVGWARGEQSPEKPIS